MKKMPSPKLTRQRIIMHLKETFLSLKPVRAFISTQSLSPPSLFLIPNNIEGEGEESDGQAKYDSSWDLKRNASLRNLSPLMPI
jgi:hypothetical protein